MKFRFDNLLEQWAEYYLPLSHNPSREARHRTFFRLSMIDANSEFVRNFATTPSPCMGYAAHIDAELAQQNPKNITYRHVIYFMIKQPQSTLSKTAATDEQGATEARFETDEMAQDLLSYLFTLKGIANGKTKPADLELDLFDFPPVVLDKATREGLRGLQLDGAHWGTLPVAYAGWQICGLTIEQLQPRQLCIAPNKYRKTKKQPSI